MCHEKKSSESPSKCAHAIVVIGSIAVIGLAVASAALMASARECTIYAAYGARPYIVTYRDFTPFVYLVVANAIAASFEAIAVFLSVWNKGKDKTAKKLMPFIGAAVPALLYSSTGAAFAAGANMTYCSAYGGKRINICSTDAGSNFCGQVHLAVYLSLAAAATVSSVQVLKSLALTKKSGGGSDSDSDSESDVCGHGCHSKH